jgi:aspartate 1-decarboxylase
MRESLRSKIRKTTATEANLHHVGSISIDEDLMDHAQPEEFERVLVAFQLNDKRPSKPVKYANNAFKDFLLKDPKRDTDGCQSGTPAA